MIVDFYTSFDIFELLVGIASRYASIGVVSGVMQRDVAGIRVKDCDDFSLRFPIGAVIHDELKVEKRSGQIPFERQSTDAGHKLHVRQLHRDIDMKRLL